MLCEVLVSGCFNVLHPDHVRLIEFASRFGKVTIGINADPYLVEKYGESAIPLIDRAYILSSLRLVENVVSFSERDPSQLILRLAPRYYVKGPDYRNVELPEQDALDRVGAKLLIRSGPRVYSSSKLMRLQNKN